jgi:hypothetical protein
VQAVGIPADGNILHDKAKKIAQNFFVPNEYIYEKKVSWFHLQKAKLKKVPK